jgi:hypothetical protein
MRQEYFGVRDIEGAANALLASGGRTDVYVGVGPRTRRSGTAQDIDRVHAVWADCDTEEAIDRLARFSPSPSIVIQSGRVLQSGDRGRHAYWLLGAEGVDGWIARIANARLARALGSDTSVIDEARVLRPPGTLNFKYDEPRPVTMETHTGEVFRYSDLTASLPKPPSDFRRLRSDYTLAYRPGDPLGALSPYLYVSVLAGQEIGRSGKIHCPFHDDRTPSLHVYEDGWFCFGCALGGTIIDFAAHLYGLSTRGADFHEIRRRLATDLLAWKPA